MPLYQLFIISLEDKDEVQHLQQFLLEILFWSVHNFSKCWSFRLEFTACICTEVFASPFSFFVFCFPFDLEQYGKINPPYACTVNWMHTLQFIFFLNPVSSSVEIKDSKFWKIKFNNELLCLGGGHLLLFSRETKCSHLWLLKIFASYAGCVNAFADLTSLILNVHVFFHRWFYQLILLTFMFSTLMKRPC